VDRAARVGAAERGTATLRIARSVLPVPLLEDVGAVEGRSVLVRVDVNVPLTSGTEIADDLRIRAALPSLRWLQRQGAAVTACTHLGRPKGQPDPRYSVQPVRRRLAELAPGVELLENLRFEPGETADDPGLAERLVAGHDAYVNDAFGAAHRAHASIVGPPRLLPSGAGRLLAREVEALGGRRDAPLRPVGAALGRPKVGGVPGDPGAGGEVRQVGADVPDGWTGVDIGPGSAARFGDVIHEAATVFWNGPMGVFEDPRFGGGTGAVAAAMAETRAFTVVGGGDSAAAVRRFGVDRDMDHVSTGGGASLELIEKGDLPGLTALRGQSRQ